MRRGGDENDSATNSTIEQTVARALIEAAAP
jgi:hypothetical protein